MEKLIVPKDLGKFLEDNKDELGKNERNFKMIYNLINNYRSYKFEYNTMIFISEYINEIIEVFKGEREYEIEEDEFYALIIGHENVQGKPHWAYDERENSLLINYYTGYDVMNIKMTKDEWEELGINDSNAIFTLTL